MTTKVKIASYCAIFGFILFILPKVALADKYSDACAAQGWTYTPFSCSNNACGFGNAAVSCEGCGSSEITGKICCYRGTTTSEYLCVSVTPSGLTTTTAEPDATKVDLGLGRFTEQEKKQPVIFKPQVGIPGSVTIGGRTITFKKGEAIVVTGDTIAQYMAVFYRFFVMLLVVVAVAMISWGGFKRLMAAGSSERIQDSNDVIFKAIIGLCLSLISYSLLNLINPALVGFKPLQIDEVKKIDFDVSIESDEDVAVANQSATLPALAVIQGDNVSNLDNQEADLNVVLAINAVAGLLRDKGIGLIVTSGTRSIDAQRSLILKNCQNPPGSDACNPKPGRPTTCMLKDGTAKSCPHTSGKAVDLWAAPFGAAPISQKKCLSDRAACERTPAMSALIEAMRDQGFCKLCSEPWHFEVKNDQGRGMSACCN